MASVRYVPKSGALRTFMRSAEVGAMTSRAADQVQSAANGMLSDDGYRNEGFEKKAMEGNGYVVRTKTDHARYSQNKNKTLTKAFKTLG